MKIRKSYLGLSQCKYFKINFYFLKNRYNSIGAALILSVSSQRVQTLGYSYTRSNVARGVFTNPWKGILALALQITDRPPDVPVAKHTTA